MRYFEQKLRKWFILPSSGMHLDLVDGLRGVAILMVVLGHGFFANPASNKIIIAISQWVHTGWMGVRLFFVLSGFLIALPFFQKRQSEGQFGYVRGYALRRLLKIFPPFYIVTAALALYYYYHYSDPQYFKLGFLWACGYAHFVPLSQYFNSSFWSLWVEVGFYLVLPMFFLMMGKTSVKTAGKVIFLALVVVPPLIRTLTWPDGGTEKEILITASRFPNGLDFFAWGVWFASYYVSYSGSSEQRQNLARWGVVGVLLLAGCSLLFAVTPEWVSAGKMSLHCQDELRHYLPTISGVLILFLAFDPANWAARLFSTPWLRFLGVISYEWFLIHQPIQFQFLEMLPEGHGNPFRFALRFGLPFVLTFLAAVLLYQCFSLPILRWGRSRLKQSKRNVRLEPVTSS